MKSHLQKHNKPKRKQHKKLTLLNSFSLTSPHNFQHTQPKRLLVKAHSEQKTQGITLKDCPKITARKTGTERGRLAPQVRSGTIDLSELLASAGNMKKCRVGLILYLLGS